MPNFRKKPVVIEARQFDGSVESARMIIDWCKGSKTPAHMGDMDGDHQTLYIQTLESGHVASPNDWIICGVQGEFYPCKPDIFAATYEPA